MKTPEKEGTPECIKAKLGADEKARKKCKSEN